MSMQPVLPSGLRHSTGSAVARRQSPFKTLLTRALWSIPPLIVIWLLLVQAGLDAHGRGAKVVGHDTVPSIIAAEQIRGRLGDANGQLANIILTDEGSDGPFYQAFRDDIRQAEADLVTASQNITYGDAEKTPITTILTQLAVYEEIVGRARASGSDARAKALALQADALMRNTILPAAVALDKANDDQLNAAYGAQREKTGALALLRNGAALGILGILGALQFACFRYARRVINPGLAAATALVAMASVWCVVVDQTEMSQLKRAKADAFDSIYALSVLQAVANDANASESFWLLAYDDPRQRQAYADLFLQSARQIVGEDPSAARRDALSGRRFQGLMGDEFANITFDGEQAAATRTLEAWSDYMGMDARLRALREAGQTQAAIAFDVGSAPGQSNWAFGQFDRALARLIQINQTEFDQAIVRAEAATQAPVRAALAVLALLAAVAVWIGVRSRLRDYDF